MELLAETYGSLLKTINSDSDSIHAGINHYKKFLLSKLINENEEDRIVNKIYGMNIVCTFSHVQKNEMTRDCLPVLLLFILVFLRSTL